MIEVPLVIEIVNSASSLGHAAGLSLAAVIGVDVLVDGGEGLS